MHKHVYKLQNHDFSILKILLLGLTIHKIPQTMVESPDFIASDLLTCPDLIQHVPSLAVVLHENKHRKSRKPIKVS